MHLSRTPMPNITLRMVDPVILPVFMVAGRSVRRQPRFVKRLDEGIEAGVVGHAIQSVAERVARARRRIRAGYPHRRLTLAAGVGPSPWSPEYGRAGASHPAKRSRTSVHTADTKSTHEIFLPSAKLRPS